MPLPTLPVPTEESPFRLILRSVIVIAVYVIAMPAWVFCWISVISGASHASRGQSPAGSYALAALCWLVGAIVLIGGLSLAVWLRRRTSFGTGLSDDAYLVQTFGVPGYLTFPVQTQVWLFVFSIALLAAPPIASMIERFGVWVEMGFFLAGLFGMIVAITLLDVRVGTAFRQWMRRFYADEPLLLGNSAGVVAADWGPIAWRDIKDIRYQVIHIAKNRIPIIAFDVIAPPAPGDPRAIWSYRLYYGGALAIRVKDAVEPAADILARLKDMAAASRPMP